MSIYYEVLKSFGVPLINLIRTALETRRAQFEAKQKELGLAVVLLLGLLGVVSVLGLARGGR